MNQLKFNLNENIFNNKSNPADDELRHNESRHEFNSVKSVSKSDSEKNVDIDLTESERIQFITPKKYLNSIIIVVKARKKNLSSQKLLKIRISIQLKRLIQEVKRMTLLRN
jgi:hypothetical protein